jgi:hypothetical protein
MDDKEPPSERLAGIKLGQPSLLQQITQQGVDLKELHQENKWFHEKKTGI